EDGGKGKVAGGAARSARGRGDVDQVPAERPGDAPAGIGVARVAVAVVGEQHSVAQPPLSEPGVRQRRVGVETSADQQDRVLGGGVPWPGVAVGAARWPRRARRTYHPAHRRATEAADRLEPVDDAWPGPAALPG